MLSKIPLSAYRVSFEGLFVWNFCLEFVGSGILIKLRFRWQKNQTLFKELSSRQQIILEICVFSSIGITLFNQVETVVLSRQMRSFFVTSRSTTKFDSLLESSGILDQLIEVLIHRALHCFWFLKGLQILYCILLKGPAKMGQLYTLISGKDTIE